MMNCTDMEQLVLLQDSGELTPDQRQTLEEHLARCQPCRECKTGLVHLHVTLAAAMDQQPSPSREKLDRIHRAAVQHHHRPIMRVITQPWPVALAAAACLAFCLTTLRFSAVHQTTTHGTATPAELATEIIPIIALITGSESILQDQDGNETDITILANELLRLQDVAIDVPTEKTETFTLPEDYQPTTLQWNSSPEFLPERYG